MAVAGLPDEVLLYAVGAVASPILVAAWLWHRNLVRRERLRDVGLMFLWGALVATSVSVVLEWPFSAGGVGSLVLLAVVVAPLVEEAAKLAGVHLLRRRFTALPDGYVMGAVSGLGFAAAENVVYVLAVYAAAGGEGAVAVLVLRAFTSTFVHAAATATSGFGLVRKRLSGLPLAPYFLTAVALHAAFNGAALWTEFTGDASLTVVVLFAPAVLLWHVARRIHALERLAPVLTRPGEPALPWPPRRPGWVGRACTQCGLAVSVPPGLAWECPRCRSVQPPAPAPPAGVPPTD
ncbi:MAG TPA: PrsW family intramembrane metalloprotease [Candidatus Thermoplasmatota archaeon]|nr:PrsW family intramembrane metalloprotease [Candidatus Thermoplasmatota archaeon]